MIIVPAEPEDVPQLVTLIQNSYRGEKGWCRDTHLLGGTRVTASMIQEDLMGHPNGLLWKMVEADKPSFIIGCVYTEKRLDTNMLFVGTMCVHPDFQQRGLGKKLMQEAEQRAKDLKVKAIIFQVVKARDELIQWYERQGYQLTGESDPFPENNYGDFKASPEDLAMVYLQKDLC